MGERVGVAAVCVAVGRGVLVPTALVVRVAVGVGVEERAAVGLADGLKVAVKVAVGPGIPTAVDSGGALRVAEAVRVGVGGAMTVVVSVLLTTTMLSAAAVTVLVTGPRVVEKVPRISCTMAVEPGSRLATVQVTVPAS